MEETPLSPTFRSRRSPLTFSLRRKTAMGFSKTQPTDPPSFENLASDMLSTFSTRCPRPTRDEKASAYKGGATKSWLSPSDS
ncbi:hypothetical protein SLEP1_g7274 [Rubroshorea leprosula]|uniref:Uncharacterized protein n=1 Tax=Rubroshorea leprosula TaxID=152421 RepID=A0AAV5I2G5_9ROSI|nr:hypothetical protein SLEP1_g7274 [Rubroshorea leprosula]